MTTHQIGCQVAKTLVVQGPPYIGHFRLGVEKTPLVIQRTRSLPDRKSGGQP